MRRAPALAAIFTTSGAAELGAVHVAQAADAGDAECRTVLDRAWVGRRAVRELVNVLNPVIVIGGSIAAHRPELSTWSGRDRAPAFAARHAACGSFLPSTATTSR